MNLQPITKELLASLPSYHRHESIKKYHKWLKKVRKEDKKVMYAIQTRIYNHNLKIKPRLSRAWIYISKDYCIQYECNLLRSGEINEYFSLYVR